jgi:hypothetical protein
MHVRLRGPVQWSAWTCTSHSRVRDMRVTRLTRFAIAFQSVALLAATAIAAPAQRPPTEITHRVSCAACRVEFTALLTLGSASDPELIGGAYSIARDSRGRFYTSAFDKVKVVVFGPDGRYQTAIGRAGEGPGEFGRANSALSGIEDIWVAAGDTLHVFHSRSRVEVFDPAGSHVRSVTIPPSAFRVAQAIVENGEILLSSRLAGPSQIGQPFHIFSSTGSPMRSFGGDVRPAGSAGSSMAPRRIALSMDRSTFWSQWNYRLQRWTVGGTLLSDFDIRDISWWPPPPALKLGEVPRNAPGTPLVTSPGQISIAGVDSAGIVWVNGNVRVLSGTPPKFISTDRLEAVDPESGAIITSQVHQHRALRLIPRTNLIYSENESPDGHISFTIYRLRLIRPWSGPRDDLLEL